MDQGTNIQFKININQGQSITTQGHFDKNSLLLDNITIWGFERRENWAIRSKAMP